MLSSDQVVDSHLCFDARVEYLLHELDKMLYAPLVGQKIGVDGQREWCPVVALVVKGVELLDESANARLVVVE